MKKDKMSVFIIVSGLFIVLVFFIVLKNNINTKYESDSFYAKDVNTTNAKILSCSVKNGRLLVTTTNEAYQICIKTTKSVPLENHICWKDLENTSFSQSVYNNKQYYIWVKDKLGNTSKVKSIYTS